MFFSEIQGQDRAIRMLQAAFQGQRLHHAYLFEGPDGVGKSFTAQAFTQLLLCESPSDGEPCGQCKSCRRVQEQLHPNLRVIKRQFSKEKGALEQFIKVDQIRELKEALAIKAYEGGRRVIQIEEPELMNQSTANALLKTLEEPGPNTHFLLISSEANRLLPTILSRCQPIQFQPLSPKIVRQLLLQQGKTPEGESLSEEQAELCAQLSGGSIGYGLKLAQSPTFAQQASIIANFDSASGLNRIDQLLNQVERCLPASKSRKTAQDPLEWPIVLHILRTWYRDLALLKTEIHSQELPIVHRDLMQQAQTRAGQLTLEAILDRIEQINHCERRLQSTNCEPRLTLENLFIRLQGNKRCPLKV